MSGSKANIQPTDKPSKFEPNTTAITKGHEPKKKAKEKPREKHNKRGFQEHSLWLCKLLDVIKARKCLGESKSIVVDARICGYSWICVEEVATFCNKVENITRCTGTKGIIVGDGIWRTSHWKIERYLLPTQLRKNKKDFNLKLDLGVWTWKMKWGWFCLMNWLDWKLKQ